jgi:hypothetical protein
MDAIVIREQDDHDRILTKKRKRNKRRTERPSAALLLVSRATADIDFSLSKE